MEKRDVMVVVIAIAAFAVLAIVIQPLLAGQSIGLGGQGQDGISTPSRTIPQTTPGLSTTIPPGKRVPTTVPTTVPATVAPVTTEPWDGSVKTVGMLDQPADLPPASPTIPPDNAPNRSLTTYARIGPFTGSGTTDIVHVPYPSWVLEYTAEPTTTSGDVFPKIVIQVFDAQNPNRLVIPVIDQQIIGDPPTDPWSVKLYEGNRDYYFKVDTRFIKTYTLTIKIPTQYLG